MCQAARVCHNNGMVASVSSLLISLVIKPLAKNAILTGRSILALLAGDGAGNASAAAAPRGQHCEQCAARDGARLWSSDAAAVMATLGLVPPRRGSDDDDDDGMVVCGGCEAMRMVEEVAWGSKEAGEAELREAFGVFDRDGDGLVSAAELWGVLRRLGMTEGARYEDCARMVAAAAARHGGADGGLGFPEFKAMMEHAV
ncbi:probable calcium-binding protein CML32 [Triticum dicoccoides]|uniref:probable calcium-binding protein CML32 n=1 Tax=Triticum dicoccoides TaxID=85692 RepID=UPI0018900AEB|nr:probable calcium-binding protein CML32 [Triticum dicoccoides]